MTEPTLARRTQHVLSNLHIELLENLSTENLYEVDVPKIRSLLKFAVNPDV